MARIAGVILPNEKRIEIALTYIYGIGNQSSKDIIKNTSLLPDTKVKDLSEEDVSLLRKTIENDYLVEGDLRKEISMNIKRLIDTGSYEGLRHRRSLPVRGQRTKTNSRTRKGPKKTIGSRRKKEARK